MDRGPACLLVGTQKGVLRLQDGAVEPLSSERASVTALLALPDGELVVGTATGRIYRSANRRRQWSRSSEHRLSGPVEQFALALTAKVRLLAVAEDDVWGSDDLGASFAPLVTLPSQSGRWSLTVRPDRPGGVIAVCGGSTALESADAGETFEPTSAVPVEGRRLAIHPREADIRLVALDRGLSRSKDAGQTYQRVESIPPDRRVEGIAFRRSEPDYVAVWFRAESPIEDPDSPTNLWLSRDSGLTFAPIDSEVIDRPRDPTGEITTVAWWEGPTHRNLLVGTDRGELLDISLEQNRGRLIHSGAAPIHTMVVEAGGSRFDPESSGIHILP